MLILFKNKNDDIFAEEFSDISQVMPGSSSVLGNVVNENSGNAIVFGINSAKIVDLYSIKAYIQITDSTFVTITKDKVATLHRLGEVEQSNISLYEGDALDFSYFDDYKVTERGVFMIGNFLSYRV